MTISTHYDLAGISQLLRDAFTINDLKRFCQNRSSFRFILDYVAPAFGLVQMIDVVLEQCQKKALLDELLAAIEEDNPRQYERHRDQLYMAPALGTAMEDFRVKRDEEDRQRRQLRNCQRVVNLRPLDMQHAFKDRFDEVDDLCQHLADNEVRLISVVGRGGMGKTALASRVLAKLEKGILPALGEEQAFPVDGILYLSASSTRLSLERIYADVGRMLGEPAASRLATRWVAQDTPLAGKVDDLLEAMQGGLYLILLDNVEDCLAADGEIADEGLRLFVERSLTRPSGARLIATSREQIKVPAGALRGIRTLPLHHGLDADEAIAMLRDLDPQGELGLRDAPTSVLLAAVTFTRGIPRALELLASILHQEPTTNLPQLLEDERLLDEQVVDGLLAEGYRRLQKGELRVMEALAIFDRPVQQTAIDYLLHPWFPNLDVRAALSRLGKRYLVNTSRSSGEFSLHSLDREYVYRRIEESDTYSRRSLELRAASFYVSIRKPRDTWETTDDLAPQLAEFEHRLRAGDYDGACYVLNSIDFDYLFQWGYYGRLVEMRQKLLGHLRDAHLQVTNLRHLGLACRGLGQVEEAISLYNQALEIARESGDRAEEGAALGNLGVAYRVEGRLDRANDSLRQALAIAQELDDRRSIHDWIGNLGDIQRAQGHAAEAIRLYEQAIDITRQIGYRRYEGVWLGNLGRTLGTLGQFEQAIERLEEAIAIVCEVGDRRAEAKFLDGLGQAYYALKKNELAVQSHEQALAIEREIGNRRGQGYRLLGLGRACLAAGQPARALEYCTEARSLEVARVEPQAALLCGIALLTQKIPGAAEAFADACARCRDLLQKATDNVAAHYNLATALVGQAVCDPKWVDASQRKGLLSAALAEYRQALHLSAAPGLVSCAFQDLALIRAAGIEDLEPAFALLESAQVHNDGA